jgi:hypothetical protein
MLAAMATAVLDGAASRRCRSGESFESKSAEELASTIHHAHAQVPSTRGWCIFALIAPRRGSSMPRRFSVHP